MVGVWSSSGSGNGGDWGELRVFRIKIYAEGLDKLDRDIFED